MTQLSDIYGSNSQWLKAEDLQGAKPIVVIESAEVKENTYNGEVKKQIVLTFEGKEKQLGLNFTNASQIADLTGTQDIDEWIGVAIKLYQTTTTMGDGRKVPCIRIFPELPNLDAEPTPKAKAKGSSNTPQFTGGDEADSIPF